MHDQSSSSPSSARGRARLERGPRAPLAAGLGLLAALAIPSLAEAGYHELETDPTARWWGTYFDAQPSDLGGDFEVVVGDFNGDGYDDAARIHGIAVETQVDVFTASGDHFDVMRWANVGVGAYWQEQHYLAADTNGDGYDDIIRVFAVYDQVYIDVLISTVVNDQRTFVMEHWATAAGAYDPSAKFLAGDFDGDGYGDVAMVHPDMFDQVTIDVFGSQGSAFERVNWSVPSPTPGFSLYSKWVATDTDNDGDDDITALTASWSGGAYDVDVYRAESGMFDRVGDWDVADGCPPDVDIQFLTYGCGINESAAIADAIGGDWDGDGIGDVLVVNQAGVVDTWVLLGGSDESSLHYELVNSGEPTDRLIAGDWDGDGKTELGSVSAAGGKFSISTFGTESAIEFDAKPIRWESNSGSFNADQIYLPGDFDGDGSPEVARIWAYVDATCIDVHRNHQSGFAWEPWIGNAGGHYPGMEYLAGDFTGDGRTDVLKVWEFNGQTAIDGYIAGESGFTAVFGIGGGGGHWGGMSFVAGDFDGDSLTDVVKLWNNGGNLIADVYRSNGSGFEPFTYWVFESVPYYDDATYKVGDFDGDGKDDIARVFRDSEVQAELFDFGDFGWFGGSFTPSIIVVDYFSVDVMRSTGSSFTTSRWLTKSVLFSPKNQLVSGDFDRDDRDDLVLVTPTSTGYLGMIMFRSLSSAFETVPLLESDEIGYARDIKVVAADFDSDGRAEVATMSRSKGTIGTDFDVWGGQTLVDATLLSAPGIAESYNEAAFVARLLDLGYTLDDDGDLGDHECRVVYPNAQFDIQSRDLGVLVCAKLNTGLPVINSVAVWGGCDFANTQSCNIGLPGPTLRVFGQEIKIRGPSRSGCASISRERVCAEVKDGVWSHSFVFDSGNISLNTGFYVGPWVASNVGFNNGTIGAQLEIDGLLSMEYSLDSHDVVDAGETGFNYVTWGTVQVGGAMATEVEDGLNEVWGTMWDLGSSFWNAVSSLWSWI